MHFLYTVGFTKFFKYVSIFMSEITRVSSHVLSLYGFRIRVILTSYNEVGRISFLYWF